MLLSRPFITSRLQQLANHLHLPSLLAAKSAKSYATMTIDQSKWKFNHTMLRVKDPKRSLEYYKLLGLSLVNKLEYPENKFDLYFLGECHLQPRGGRKGE